MVLPSAMAPCVFIRLTEPAHGSSRQATCFTVWFASARPMPLLAPMIGKVRVFHCTRQHPGSGEGGHRRDVPRNQPGQCQKCVLSIVGALPLGLAVMGLCPVIVQLRSLSAIYQGTNYRDMNKGKPAIVLSVMGGNYLRMRFCFG